MSPLFESLLALTLAAPAFAQGSQSMQSAPVHPQQPGSAVTTLRTGTKLIVVDVVVTDKKADGALINAIGTPIDTDFNSALYLKALQHGIPFHEEVSVPSKGEYFVRIAVHDLQGDHVGAVEVPISSVRNLPPITSAHATAAQ